MLRSLSSISPCITHRALLRASSFVQNLRAPLSLPIMPPKRKRSGVAAASPAAIENSALDRSKVLHTTVPLPPNVAGDAPKSARRQLSRGGKSAVTNPNTNPEVLDGVSALRASPDGHEDGEPESHLAPNMSNGTVNGAPSAPSTDMKPPAITAADGGSSAVPPTTDAPAGKGKRKKAAPQIKTEPVESNGVAKIPPTENTGMAGDPEEADGVEEDELEVKEALSRPPPVNSEYLPLPWKGRLGYVRTSHTRYLIPTNGCNRRV
jgi:UV DNA damage endonuclease